MDKRIDQIHQLTREAVKGVFHSMLSLEINPESPSPLTPDPEGHIIGSVGFTGGATGIIYLYAGVGFARVITSRFLGIPEEEVDPDEMVNDAIGELSNMVVGYVKSHLCDAGLSCTMTVPAVARGKELRVESPPQVSRRLIGFHNCTHHLLAEVLLKDSSAK